MKSFYFTLVLMVLGFRTAAQPVADNNGQTASGNIVSSLTIANFSVPANNDRLLVVCTLNATNSPSPAVSFGGTTMTSTIIRSTTSGLVLAMYHLILGSSGDVTTGNIVASGTSLLHLGAASYHEVDQTNPTDGEVSGTFSSGTISHTLAVTSSAAAHHHLLMVLDASCAPAFTVH